MSLRFEMNVGIPSTYGKAIAEKPRDMQKRTHPTDKPVLKAKNDAQNY